jgi:hypothetical protein
VTARKFALPPPVTESNYSDTLECYTDFTPRFSPRHSLGALVLPRFASNVSSLTWKREVMEVITGGPKVF